MSTTCKYCNEPEDKQNRPGLICESCICFVHLTCLRRPGTPGDFACDVFFEFTCVDCAPDKKEAFVRYKFPWVNVIYLTLNHLCTQSYGISHHGYFHYKTHICSFIDRYWHALFGVSNKQKKNWVGTIAGVLSVYNKLLFKSGSVALGEAGWWRLLHNFSPAVAAHIVQEMAREKPRNRPRNQLSMERHHFTAKIAEMGYKELITLESEEPLLAADPVPTKKKRVDSEDSVISGASYYDHVDSDSRNELAEETAYEEQVPTDNISFVEIGHVDPELSDLNNFYFVPADTMPPVQSDTSSIHSLQHMLYYDSDSRSGSDPDKKHTEGKSKKHAEEKPVFRRESLFSTELNSVDLPWEEKPPEQEIPKEELVEMTQYEEVQFLKQVEGLIPKVKEANKKAYLCRLKAKLALRRLKRHKHLPVFDFDKTVKLLGGYVTEDLKVVNNAERVLDRFQRSYLIDNLCGTIASTNYGTLVLSNIEPVEFRSPYSGTVLKPYIRRDAESKPLWLRLTDELLKKTHRQIPGYVPPRHATIDYSYVRPQHIAAVNNLCAQFFWPGVDLTEALQYPEFSCVATYKRLVIGCAFLVPDAGHNRAYISFVLTRPEWSRAHIGSFMLYHLLQTCTGKDVTLHVSPTNPSIFLYQKFGFKVEELVQDFYEKYYDIDYKGCRHALFLRLTR